MLMLFQSVPATNGVAVAREGLMALQLQVDKVCCTLVWGSDWMNGTLFMKRTQKIASTLGRMANSRRKAMELGSRKAT
jgi:hypothetical protein